MSSSTIFLIGKMAINQKYSVNLYYGNDMDLHHVEQQINPYIHAIMKFILFCQFAFRNSRLWAGSRESSKRKNNKCDWRQLCAQSRTSV